MPLVEGQTGSEAPPPLSAGGIPVNAAPRAFRAAYVTSATVPLPCHWQPEASQ